MAIQSTCWPASTPINMARRCAGNSLHRNLGNARKTGLPFWRQVLRGFSQSAFQVNEVAGALLVAAVVTFHWRMAVFYVVSVVIGTFVARLLGGSPSLLDLGLYGFNSGAMGLALANFF